MQSNKRGVCGGRGWIMEVCLSCRTVPYGGEGIELQLLCSVDPMAGQLRRGLEG